MSFPFPLSISNGCRQGVFPECQVPFMLIILDVLGLRLGMSDLTFQVMLEISILGTHRAPPALVPDVPQ